jgi:enoyl-CoA hydratase
MFLFRMAKISIVQAHGYCLAGGMELAMMGDLVTGSEDCIFGHPGHRSIGVARNGMILPMVLGMRKAKELFYTGDGITGKEAERLGLINYAWPEADLEQKTIELADRVANQSADFLAVLKTVANRFYENMGLESSVQTATHFDATIQNTEQAYRFREVMQTSGLKAALQFRDGPYADYSAKPKSPKSSTPTASSRE